MLDNPAQSNTTVIRSLGDARVASVSVAEQELVALFDELRIPLLRYLLGFPLSVPDAEDVIQESFLALFQRARDAKPHQNVRGWLFRVAHNIALKKNLRSRKEVQTASGLIPVEELVLDPAPNPEAQFAFNQTRERLLPVLRALPEQNRWCLYLRAEGLRYREIADVLGVSLGSVAQSLQRSLAQIARAANR